MRALLDVNVLIALLDSEHVHHAKALHWLQAEGHLGWSSCALTINGCARILSNPSYPNPLPLAQVLKRLQAATRSPQHESLTCGLSLLDEAWFDFDRLLSASQITDAYLLALALHHGHRFITLDARINLHALRRAPGAHLVVL